MKTSLLKSTLPLLSLALLPVRMQAANESTIEESENNGVLMQALQNFQKRASKHVNFSGFFIGRYYYDSSKDNSGNFDIRMLRLILSGNISKDFGYRIQMEGSAGTPRILDAWAEWKRYSFFQVRAGQMKRSFTFENPWSPVTLGVPDYSQAIMKLSGFTDRVGEHSSGGRDIGVMVSGEFLPIANHQLFRYEMGVYNGNGINKADNNSSKDFIASLYMKPIEHLRIGGGFWTGEYGAKENKVDRRRWTTGFSYDDGKYVLRGEYLSSKGGVSGKPTAPKQSNGWYITGGMPLSKKLKGFVKYDVYRDDQTKQSQSTKYMASLNWTVHKYIILQATYFYNENKQVGVSNSNNAVAQMYIRF